MPPSLRGAVRSLTSEQRISFFGLKHMGVWGKAQHCHLVNHGKGAASGLLRVLPDAYFSLVSNIEMIHLVGIGGK
jgi:hypothetical protein